MDVLLDLIVIALVVLPVIDIFCTVFMYRLYRQSQKWRPGRPNPVLRDRLVASVIQTTTVTLVGLLAFDRLIGNPVNLPGDFATLILSAALLILGIPPIYWFWNIYRA